MLQGTRRLILVPEQIQYLPLIVSVSGGKDSTALVLALRESDIPVHSYVFADTGWEAAETYDYLSYLETVLGASIVRVRGKRDMIESIRHRAGFPARMQRWCTRELKIQPLRKYHDTVGDDTVSVLGIRAAESMARAKMLPLVDEPPGERSWGGWIWRPLLDWSVVDVLEIHRRHNVTVNPLYQRGHSRVGCYPCIYANKEEISLLSPERIALIRSLEEECEQLRKERNDERPGRYTYPHDATFFQTRSKGEGPMKIDEVFEWAQTARGGRQLEFAGMPRGGCMRWGICDLPEAEEKEDDQGR